MYRKTDIKVWDDEKVKALTYDGMAHLLGLLSHHSLTMAGTAMITAETLAADLHCPVRRTERALTELAKASIVVRDRSRSVIWFRNFLRYNPPTSPNMARGIQLAALRVRFSDDRIRDQFLVTVRGYLQGFSHLRWGSPSEAAAEAAATAAPEALTKPSRRAPEAASSLTEAHKHISTEAQEQTDTPRACACDKPNQETTTAEPTTVVNGTAGVPGLRSVPVGTGNEWGEIPTRRRLSRMAWEARRKGLSVPQHLHEELLSKLPQPPDEAALIAWYGEVTEAIPDEVAIGDDVHTFWRNHFAARWPSAAPTPRERKRAASEELYRKSKAAAEEYERQQQEARRS